jgi:hypothetical protein
MRIFLGDKSVLCSLMHLCKCRFCVRFKEEKKNLNGGIMKNSEMKPKNATLLYYNIIYILFFIIVIFVISSGNSCFALNSCASSDNFNDNSFDTGIWTNTTLGTASNGSVSETGNALDVSVQDVGIVSSIGTGSDNVDFVYQQISSSTDFTITMKVPALSNNNSSSAGIMVRDSLAAGSEMYLMTAIYSQENYAFVTRAVDGDNSVQTHTGDWTTLAMPRYVKLVKSGTSISGYYSADGVTWTQEGSTATGITFDADMYVGIAVTSDYNNPGTSTVDDFNFTCSAGAPTDTPTNTPVAPTATQTATAIASPTMTNTPVPVQLNKSMSENPAMLGDVVTFYLSYTNGGSGSATFHIWDTVPYVMNYVSCSCNGASGCAACTVDGANRVVSWNLINVPAGASGLVWFTARVVSLPFLMDEKNFYAYVNNERYALNGMRLLDRDKVAGIADLGFEL